MRNEQVYNQSPKSKDRAKRVVEIRFGSLILHDGEQNTASIEYLEGKNQSREHEQINRDQGVFYNQKKGIKQILIKGRTKENDRESLLHTIERMKAELAKPEQQWLKVKENEREREWKCIVNKFNLAEHNWNINWIERELELLTYNYGRNPQARLIESSIIQETTSIPIERGGTAPAVLGRNYTVETPWNEWSIQIWDKICKIKKDLKVWSILLMQEWILTLDGEKIGFDGVYPRLEAENQTVKIQTNSRGELQLFYHLSYE